MPGLKGIDICERARDALSAAGLKGASVKRLDALTGRGGIVVRLMPSTTQRTYYNGSRDVLCYFQVVSKRRDPLQAMNDCQAAEETVPMADLASRNGSYEISGPAEVDSVAQEVAVGHDGMHVWAVRFRASITVRR